MTGRIPDVITVARPDPRSDSVVVFVNGFPVFIGTEAKAAQVIRELRGCR